jgi:hypothetical protein
MRRKLSRHGNGWAFVIEKPIMELLGYTPDTEFDVQTSGGKLTLVPLDEEKHRAKFEEAKAFVFSVYDKTLRKLAE